MLIPRNPALLPRGATISLGRGIYRDRASFGGSSVFHIVDHEGRLRFRIEPSAEDSNARTVAWLWRALDILDPPPPALQIID